jgi:thiol-disulfide isomerase/thioredoxin
MKVFIGVLLSIPCLCFSSPSESELYFFWAYGCNACRRAEGFLQELESLYPELIIRKLEVTEIPENMDLYRRMARERGTGAGIVPAIFVPSAYWIGFNDIYKNEIDSTVQIGLGLGWSAAVNVDSRLLRGDLDLPFFGSISIVSFSAFTVTSAIAFIDGFNPCSLWVLTFLIGLIIRSGSRLRTFAVGFIFLFVSAVVYGLFILGLASFLLDRGTLIAVRISIGIAAVLMGLINIKDYLFLN